MPTQNEIRPAASRRSPARTWIAVAILAGLLAVAPLACRQSDSPPEPTPGESGQPEALPGSGLMAADAIGQVEKAGDAFAIVAEAQADAFPVDGYLLLERGLMMRQAFTVRAVLAGDLKEGQEVNIDYAVLERDGVKERAIRKGEQVIWIGQVGQYIDVHVTGVKALPDTPENRKAVAEAVKSAAPAAPTTQGDRAQSLTLEIGNKVTMKLVRIPAGRFMMGSPKSEAGRSHQAGPENPDHVEPLHEVTISKPFYMSIYPVTQEQYEAVVGGNPSLFKDAGKPVEGVSWEEAEAFCRKLSTVTGKTVVLPTEAQWEYACRAGTATPFNTGPTITTDQANFDGTYIFGDDFVEARNPVHREGTTPVGTFKPNAWGLYDMHGNVWQYCSDWMADMPPGPATDPAGPSKHDPGVHRYGSVHVIRGGCWQAFVWTCRSAYRGGIPAGGRYSGGGGYFGFRVAVLDPPAELLPPDLAEKVATAQAEARLTRRLSEIKPEGWSGGSVNRGRVQPMCWDAGPGMQFVWQTLEDRPEFKLGRAGMVTLWVMNPDYVGKRDEQAVRYGQPLPAREIATWRGRRAFFWGGGDWATAEADILAALKATDSPPAPAPAGGQARPTTQAQE